MKLTILLLGFVLVGVTQGFEFNAGPYLQNITPTSVTIRMEGSFSGHPQILFFRESETEVFSVHATLIERANHPDNKVALYEAKLMGLVSGVRYLYQIEQGGQKSKLFLFKTLFRDPHPFAFVVMSDAQSGSKVTSQIVDQSVMKYAFASYLDERTFPMSFALFTGDLVQKGNEYKRWSDEFFTPMAQLLTRLSVYTAIGNHEENTPYYFSYFELPQNGTPEFFEHWYYFDYQNVRFITLDSNPPYNKELQLGWLDGVLSETERHEELDFVVLQLHQPADSELWIEGESLFSKAVNVRLAAFNEKSGKPAVVIAGHTHGYSRGHDPHQALTMLVNGSIGGDTDNWGEFKQTDYLNYLKSKDEHGWCLVQVQNGQNATLSFKRYSFGKDGDVRDYGLVDQFLLRKNNIAPDPPSLTLTQQIDGSTVIMGSRYHETQGDSHLSTEWQAAASATMDKLIWSRLNHAYNEYGGIFHDQKESLSKLRLNEITGTAGLKTYFVRARYRDSALGYSEWSTPVKVEPVKK